MSNLLKPDLYGILFNHTDFNTKLQGMLTYLILAKITKWLILTLIFLKIKYPVVPNLYDFLMDLYHVHII